MTRYAVQIKMNRSPVERPRPNRTVWTRTNTTGSQTGMTRQAIFRAEVLAARRESWIGTVELTTQAWVSWTLLACVIALGALAGAVLTSSHTRRISVETRAGAGVEPKILHLQFENPTPVVSATRAMGPVLIHWNRAGGALPAEILACEPPSRTDGRCSSLRVRLNDVAAARKVLAAGRMLVDVPVARERPYDWFFGQPDASR